MAVEKGTAANAFELYDKLETFLTANGWISHRDNVPMPYQATTRQTAGKVFDTISARFYQGGGLDGNDKIYVSMFMYYSVPTGAYTINACMARHYDKLKNPREQFGIANEYRRTTTMPVWNQPMKYWFIASGRRFIVIAKVANRYVSMYCGLFLPSGTDEEYAYPYFLGANCTNETTAYSYQNIEGMRSFFNPIHGNSYTDSGNVASYHTSTAMCYLPSGEWCPIIGGVDSLSNYWNTTSYSHPHWAIAYPYSYPIQYGKTPDNQFLLKPIYLAQRGNSKQILGWLDGVYWVTGYENSPETIVTIDGKEYLCIPSIFQNGFNDYAAILLE